MIARAKTVAPRSSTVERGMSDALRTPVTQVLAIVTAEAQKLRHDPIELLTRSLQPVLWLLLFGEVMAQFHGPYDEKLSYLDFLAPGILAQSVLFVSIFYGLSAIWERDLGVLNRYLVSPAPRSILVLGKAVSAAVRGLAQALIIYLLSAALRVQIDFSPLHILAVIVMVTLGSALFSTLSLIIACIVKNREHFMGVGQLVTMPIFFASSAIYPLSVMPAWLRAISAANPLTYQVDALRALMISGGQSEYGLAADFGILIAVLMIATPIAAWMYPRMAY
ncbi:MAG TPA: ABC transporter permease [Roseiarcus sp.]|nr:ABC transporter permease [Roseiarcus sp.]